MVEISIEEFGDPWMPVHQPFLRVVRTIMYSQMSAQQHG